MPLWTVKCECVKSVDGLGNKGDLKYFGNVDTNNMVMAQIQTRNWLTPNWRTCHAMMQGHRHDEKCKCEIWILGG